MQTPLSIPIFEQISACADPGAAPSAVLGVQISGPIFRQARSPAQAWLWWRTANGGKFKKFPIYEDANGGADSSCKLPPMDLGCHSIVTKSV
eukprot:5063594-Pleurochrysis_carterae.AAC.1